MRRSSPDSISARQTDIFHYIENFVGQHGYSPSIRDIQNALGISSTSVVAYNLRILTAKGWIEREDKISRGIRPKRNRNGNGSVDLFRVPLLGTITAGGPLPDPEEVDPSSADKVAVPPDLADVSRLGDVYALKVRGQSMIDALIDDGDIVLLRFQNTAENGQMVAARLLDDNAVTLKKFYHEGEQVRLQPANQTMSPIYVPADNVVVQGRVVGVIRSLM
jgi:repressor LexA